MAVIIRLPETAHLSLACAALQKIKVCVNLNEVYVCVLTKHVAKDVADILPRVVLQ
jgi:hypothetical protein